MVTIHPKRIPGRWVDGYALDFHSIGSIPIGYNEYGHLQFDTKRTEIGELLYRLKYNSDLTTVPEIIDAVRSFIANWRPAIDLIVPVPASRYRPVQPVSVLVEGISQQMEIPFSPNAVNRIRDIQQLKDVFDYSERLDILRGAHERNNRRSLRSRAS